MGNSTKERLTGALILVAALVILVPEMLSGPREGARRVAPAQDPQAGPPMRTYDMPLDPAAAGQRSQALAPTPVEEVAAVPPPVTETAPPSAQVAAPPPAEEGAAPQEDAAAPAQLADAGSQPPSTKAPETPNKPATKPVEKPVAQDAAAASAKPAAPQAAPANATGKWWVQAGVFASADNAQRLARELKSAGIPAVVSQITAQGKQMHRVRAGPVADRPAALALQAKLAAKGHKSSLVAP